MPKQETTNYIDRNTSLQGQPAQSADTSSKYKSRSPTKVRDEYEELGQLNYTYERQYTLNPN